MAECISPRIRPRLHDASVVVHAALPERDGDRGFSVRRTYGQNIRLPAESAPAIMEVGHECPPLGRILAYVTGFGRAVTEFISRYHFEHNHQGKGNLLLFPEQRKTLVRKSVKGKQRLGGLFKYYARAG
jgi:hypothetical protein